MSVENRSQRKERQTQTLFEIRAHRLEAYAALIAGTETPAGFAEKSVKVLTGTFRDITPDNVDLDALRTQAQGTTLYQRAYKYDTIGHTQAQADETQRNRQQVFQEFIDLPDDALIKITESPDEICKRGCFIGRHCHNDGGEVSEDRLALSVFKAMANERGLGDTITVTSDQEEVFGLYFGTDSRIITVKSIITTKKTLQEVFAKGQGAENYQIPAELQEAYDDLRVEIDEENPVEHFRARKYLLSQSFFGRQDARQRVKDFDENYI